MSLAGYIAEVRDDESNRRSYYLAEKPVAEVLGDVAKQCPVPGFVSKEVPRRYCLQGGTPFQLRTTTDIVRKLCSRSSAAQNAFCFFLPLPLVSCTYHPGTPLGLTTVACPSIVNM